MTQINGIPANETVIVKTKIQSGVNSTNDPIYTYTTKTIHCLVGYTATSTQADAVRVIITDTYTLYLPAGTVIKDSDTLIYKNEEYTKEGNADNWNSPFGAELGVVIRIKRVNG